MEHDAKTQALTPESPASNGVSSPDGRKGTAAPKSAKRKFEKKITLAALKLANENGIDINELSGSGQHGRILKADVEKAVRDSRSD